MIGFRDLGAGAAMRTALPQDRGLTPDPAATALRSLALSALREVFGVAQDAQQPDLTPLDDWFGERWVAGPMPDEAVAQLADRFFFGSAQLTDPVHRTIVGAAIRPIGRLFWARQMVWRWRNRAAPRRQDRAVPGVADLHTALLHSAFSDAAFRQSVANMALHFLSARVLFHPALPPVVQLAPQTLTALLLARALPMRSTVMEALTAAHNHALALPGWAGFWDQWVLGLAASRPGWTLPAPLSQLPLARGGAAALTDNAATDPDICTTGWREHTPAYCHQLLSGLP